MPGCCPPACSWCTVPRPARHGQRRPGGHRRRSDARSAVATELAKEYWRRRAELEPELHTPDQAVAAGLQVEGTVLLVETAAGDSAASLKALPGAALPGHALVPVVDPVAASACHAAGTGSSVTVAVGHRLDPQWG